MSVVLREAGHEVHVRSTVRNGHPPPPCIHWTPFLRAGSHPPSLKRDAFTTARTLASYPFAWARAIHRARASGVDALLVTTNLALWRTDTWAMRRLARHGPAPVVLVHKPYHGIFDDMAGKRAPRYRAFYESAAYVLTMSAFTREWMQARYPLPEGRYLHCPHPHFQPLLDRYSTNGELVRRLREWAGGAPVIAFLSNMRSEQGLDTLLSSLPFIDSELADWRLLLVSAGGGKREVEAAEGRLAGLGFRERCWRRWDTYSPADLNAYVEAASLVVAPYHHATQSGVVALAAGAGLPVVATEAGGLPEMVRPGVNGESVPPGNPAELARAIAGVAGRLAHYRRGARSCRDVLFSPGRPGRPSRTPCARLRRRLCRAARRRRLRTGCRRKMRTHIGEEGIHILDPSRSHWRSS